MGSIIAPEVFTRCPHCKLEVIARDSMLRGRWEPLLYRLYVRPFRCEKCKRRFYRLLHGFTVRPGKKKRAKRRHRE